MTAASLFLLSGVLLGLMIVAALLLRRDPNYRANRLLAASLGCSICYLLSITLLRSEWAADWRALSPLGIAFFASAPLMFGYVKLLTSPDYQLTPRDAMHPVLPVLLFTLISIAFPGELSPTTGNLEQARGGWPPNPLALLGIGIYLWQCIYLGWSLVLLRRHRAALADTYSYREKVSLGWLHVLIAVYLSFCVLGLCIALLRLVPGLELWPRALYSTSMLIAVYYLIAFIALVQPTVVLGNDTKQPDSGPGEPRYQTSALRDEDIRRHWQTLVAVMGDKKPYLDSKLRIADLADVAGIPAHQLSQVINQQAGQNFFEFINQHRVAAAKDLLRREQPSMTAVAFDAGFNSQSAFYRQFKRETGLTPREYQRQEKPTDA